MILCMFVKNTLSVQYSIFALFKKSLIYKTNLLIKKNEYNIFYTGKCLQFVIKFHVYLFFFSFCGMIHKPELPIHVKNINICDFYLEKEKGTTLNKFYFIIFLKLQYFYFGVSFLIKILAFLLDITIISAPFYFVKFLCVKILYDGIHK